MAKCDPIGIFDSGIGGLSIAKEIKKLLPSEHIVYVADTGHAPYGDQSDQYILQRSLAITDFLVSHNVKTIVVACNTATTGCIATLRERYNVPFIGVEPGIMPGILNTKSGVVGVLATSKTLITPSFAMLAGRVAANINIEIMPCPDLVLQVEALKLDYSEAAEVVKKYVLPLLEKGADTLVLGCTHYGYLAHVIAQVAGPNVTLIDTQNAVAKEVMRRLENGKLLGIPGEQGKAQFYSSGNLGAFQRQVKKLWGDASQVQPL
ncbi:MAG: glutamate racemase [Paraglaciecola sp.]|jgi:glutamate racemase